MNLIKEHHHTLLVTLFLIGALFVAGSFETRLPDSATAASTPGQQSVTKTAIWNSSTAGVHNMVQYTGEVRKGGALIQSADVLNPGDQLSVKLIENASFFLDGSFNDSPPSPWIDKIIYRADYSPAATGCILDENGELPLHCTWPGVGYSGNQPPGYFIIYMWDNLDLLKTYCQVGGSEIWKIGSGASIAGDGTSLYYCLSMGIEKRAPALSSSGLNCGALSASDPDHGIREFSTNCTVTTPGPTATLSINAPSTITGPISGQLTQEGSNMPGVTGPKIVIDSAQLNWSFDVAPVIIPAPTLTFVGAPTTITQGDSATLTWSSQNTTSCNASNGWSGSKSTSGSENVTPPSTTIYNLSCQGPGGNVSSSVTISVNPVCPSGQTKPHSECQSGSCVSVDSCGVSSCSNNGQCIANQAPVANAKISKDGVIYSDSITVTKGVPTTIFLGANDSSDPDGWTHPQNGVSNGGKCEWNADLEQTSPTFEQVINNPASPSACNISLGTKTFNDSAGTYTYQVLKITDNKGATSNIDTVQVQVLAPEGFSCNSSNQCVFGGGGASCLTNAGCPGGGGGGGCVGNCGGGGGGGGGGGAGAPIATNPLASALGSDTSFFCPSHQVQTNWSYSDPNGNPQASFRVQIDDSSDFSSMIIDAYKDTSDKFYITPADVLAFGTQYYFRVAVKDSTGAWSNWSSSANFKTPASCLVLDFALNSSNNISVNVTGAGSGTSNASQITVTPFSGFNSAVNLSVQSVSPNLPGAVYSLVPSAIPQSQYSSGSTFKVTVPGTTAPGNYIITIKGEDGGFTRTVNVNLKVNSTSPVFREI